MGANGQLALQLFEGLLQHRNHPDFGKAREDALFNRPRQRKNVAYGAGYTIGLTERANGGHVYREQK